MGSALSGYPMVHRSGSRAAGHRAASARKCSRHLGPVHFCDAPMVSYPAEAVQLNGSALAPISATGT